MLIAFTATSSDKATAAEAQQLDTRLGGWEFEIPEYRYSGIFRALDDLLKPPPEPKKKKAAAHAPAPGTAKSPAAAPSAK
jgi:hypothetical protein